MAIEIVVEQRMFEGTQGVYRHASRETRCPMRFGVYLPLDAKERRVPVVMWLSGLTCTEENFIVKAGAQRVAARLGVALVVPDTSPRDVALPGDRDHWDFGVGAGFYVDATEPPWNAHYRMHSYVTEELPDVVADSFNVDRDRMAILGHSMGGHGALVAALRHPSRFRSVSAFAPIASPMRCPWGVKALSGYVGNDRSHWREWDATALVEDRGWRGPPILVDQGTTDSFLDAQLRPSLLEEACSRRDVKLKMRYRDGYDHSYFFIATFIEAHLEHHAHYL
ncbi:MAG TPA: S-formylglutathione hydrolase [Casimicrobiaceae bacterium]|nr:S-formylglutathione hydrolase [Casimicrobiaceae bacterium]